MQDDPDDEDPRHWTLGKRPEYASGVIRSLSEVNLEYWNDKWPRTGVDREGRQL